MKPHSLSRPLLRRVLLAVLASASCATAWAQNQFGTLEGRVIVESTGARLQGAIVRVVGTDLRAETDRQGAYSLRNLPEGEHQIEISYFGLPTVKTTVTIVGNQTQTKVIDMAGTNVTRLETLKVEAEVLGQARAINQQRTAQAMVNITSEELFGEMSDNNVAKAIQRIPGLSANSDGFSEVPRYVNIRGFDGSLNSVQLNGARLPTSGTGQGTVYGDTARAFALDDLPANAITSIEVVKSPTPDMDGDSVGGIVNLITKSALDLNSRRIDFSVGGDYVRLRDKIVPNFTLGFGDVFFGGRLGVQLNLSYFKGDEGFDNIDYDSLPLVPQLPFNAYLNIPTAGRPTFAHEDTEYNNYFIERDRRGLAASFDYRLSDQVVFHFRPVITTEERVENDIRYHKIMDNDHGRAAPTAAISGTSFADTAIGETYTATRGTAVKTSATSGAYRTYEGVSIREGSTSLLPNGTGRGSAGYRQSLNERDLDFYSLDFGAKHEMDWGTFKWSLFNSTSSKDELLDSVRFDRNGLRWAYTRDNILRPDYRVVNGLDPLAIPTRGAPDFFINPSSSNITRANRTTEETVNMVKADLEIPFFRGTGINGDFKTGLKARFMERESDRDQLYWRLTSSSTYDFASYLKQNSNTVAGFAMPYHPDTRRIIGEATAGNGAYTRDTGVSRRLNSLNNDYKASEDSLEGYGMGVFKVGPKLQIITGARVEHTQFAATTPVYDPVNPPLANKAPQTRTDKNDYTVVLPGVHLRYEARNNLVGRAAYTQTYGRPAFRESIAVTTFDDVNNTISTGNPDLLPYNSNNWDFSLEYFGKKASYFQIALFHKEVKNFVLETSETIDGSEGYRGLPLNPGETYTVATFSNKHDAVNQGVEIAARYRFVNLPAPLDGLYVDGSVTYTDSNGRYADRPGEKLPTYGASEWLYTAGLGYQKDRWAVLLSYRFRSEYLEGLESIDQQNRELGFPPDSGDDWWGDEKYWNFESSYRVTSKLKVYCNVSNLGEYTNHSFQSPPNNRYPEDSYWHKMRISFGVKGEF